MMAMSAGCVTHTGAKVGIASGLGVIGVGVLLWRTPGGETDPKDLAPIPFSIGATILAVSIYVLLTTKDETTDDEVAAAKPAGPDPRIAERAKAREHAWELTKQAMAAGRADDCPTVVRFDAEVRALDAEFYADVFARDRGIARCLPQR